MIIKIIEFAGIWLLVSIVCLALWNAAVGGFDDDNFPKP